MEAPTEKKKRYRAPNFTNEEHRLLLKLALAEKGILENKRTDSAAWKMKDDAWLKITNSFNAISGQTCCRSVDTLRHKYEGLKKGLKKKVNQNRAEVMKTVGGKPEFKKIEDEEKELLGVLSIQISGLPSQFDSDSVLPEISITGEPLTWEVEEKEDVLVEPSIDKAQEVEDIPVLIVTENEKNHPEKVEILNSPGLFVSASEDKSIKKRSWKNWSAEKLRTKKHPVFTPKRTCAKESLNLKVEENLGLREELLQQEIPHVKNKEKRAQEKHEKEIELLNLLLSALSPPGDKILTWVQSITPITLGKWDILKNSLFTSCFSSSVCGNLTDC